MFKNYFKTAWRNLLKDKQFSLLNLLGLATGLACVLLIFLWVSDELSIDKFNANDSRLYQVLKRNPNGYGGTDVHETTQGLLAQSMAKDLPEVEYATSLKRENDNAGILSLKDKKIKIKPAFAGKDFFNVFSYPIIIGDKKNSLSNISGILLSDKTALKLFNTTNVVGKTIKCSLKDDEDDFTNLYTITAVFKAPPSNATEQFDVLFPFELYAQKKAGGQGDITFWGSNMASTYLLLRPSTNIIAFNDKIKNYTKAKMLALDMDKGFVGYEGDLFIQQYSDRYLHNNYINGVPNGGRIEYVKLFSIIAIFILVIACINFMNLSTAKASQRMKEVGIKKVVGASKSSLIFQYITESILMAFASLCVALLIAYLLIPAFRQITGKEISLQLNFQLIIAAISIAVITGFIAGSYPAFYLSSFKPVSILKGKLKTTSGELFVRKGLVIFQFTISVVLIISVLVIYRQMNLIQTTNLGYNKNNVIRFANDGNLSQHLTPFLTELKHIHGVVNASDATGDLIGNYDHEGSGIDWQGKDPDLNIDYYGNMADAGYFETMNLQMAEGRTFSDNYADSSSVIFNQSAIAAMGLKNPVGKIVTMWGKKMKIIGVTKNYHYESFYKKIGSSFFIFSNNNSTIVAKINATVQPQTIAAIEHLYNTYNPGLDFNYAFLDDDYNKLYASEQRVATLSKYFAGIAILISCLGLFGLAAFTAQKRKKEIGIRKVIGASITSVVAMLSKDFLILVGIALLIAFPVSWWIMNNWLQSFAYRINISPFVFLMSGISVVLITLITISFQSIKAAMANPVESLKTE